MPKQEHPRIQHGLLKSLGVLLTMAMIAIPQVAQADGPSDDTSGAAEATTQPTAQSSSDVDHKPVISQMLSYNNKIDTGAGGLRMDFQLRVAHGDVDPQCIPLAGTDGTSGRDGSGACGLQLFYDDNFGGTQLRRLSYLNTLGAHNQGDTTPAKLQEAATQWAQNDSAYFTIHGVDTSKDGKYDYLAISAQGDVDYSKLSLTKGNKLGGEKHNLDVYAVVKPGKVEIPQNAGENPTQQYRADRSSVSKDSRYSANITQNYPVFLYRHTCASENGAGSCAGPIAYVGNGDKTGLWSGHQANWGLPVSSGFNVGGQNQGAGVAPAKSFLAFWGVPGYGDSHNMCGNVTDFYYEWMGRKDGTWVPVTSLNSKALVARGQQPSAPFDASQSVEQKGFAYNVPDSHNSAHTIMGNGDAQRPDGSIDFAKAKAEQGLDGYFKLVTWPITTNANGSLDGCTADVNQDGKAPATGDSTVHQIYNPLSGQEQGITADMASRNPKQAQQLMDEGWTVGTAFEGFGAGNPTNTANTQNPATGNQSDGSGANQNQQSPMTRSFSFPGDHTPVMEKMLAYNSRVDVNIRPHSPAGFETRDDFVLRVAHGDVKPGCIGLSGTDEMGRCGLQIFYSYDDAKMSNAQWPGRCAWNHRGMVRSAAYMNTYRDDNPAGNTKDNLRHAASSWAANTDSRYTIHDLSTDGRFDYLTISLEGFAPYPERDCENLNGDRRDFHVYALVNDGYCHKPVDVNAACGPGGCDLYHGMELPAGVFSSDYIADIMKCYPIYLYKVDGSNFWGHYRNNQSSPLAYVGYGNNPNLWSGGQANWGLETANGFEGRREAEGTAPARSFFTYWYNWTSPYNRCANYSTRFAYQWFGFTRDGRWEPVRALTPRAETVWQEGDRNADPGHARFNKAGQLIVSGDAQNPDGSIDFAKAKAEQPGLTGYFKLITWPVGSNENGCGPCGCRPCWCGPCGCGSGWLGDVNNPLAYNSDGVTDDLLSYNPSQAAALMDKGWVVDTDFQDYSYHGGNVPTNNSTASVETVTVPHTVKTNGELPKGSMVTVSGNVNNSDSGGATLKVYAKLKNQIQPNSAKEIVADEANKIGEQHIEGTGNAPYTLSVAPGRFLQHVMEGDDYDFVAVVVNSMGQVLSDIHPQQVDMTSPLITVNTHDLNTVEGNLNGRDSHKDLSGMVVVVTWEDGSQSQAKVTSSGNWSVVTKKGLSAGSVLTIDTTDSAGNEAASVKTKLLPPAQHYLPVTGSEDFWLILSLLALAVAVYGSYVVYYKKQRSRARHRG